MKSPLLKITCSVDHKHNRFTTVHEMLDFICLKCTKIAHGNIIYANVEEI